jgi:hypothetical protein
MRAKNFSTTASIKVTSFRLTTAFQPRRLMIAPAADGCKHLSDLGACCQKPEPQAHGPFDHRELGAPKRAELRSNLA